MALTFAKDGQLRDTWYIRRGSTFIKTYRWKSGTAGAELPVNLTGWTARGGIYDKDDNTIPLLLLSTATNVTLSADGLIEIEIAADVSTIILKDKGVFDLELVSGDGGYVKNFVGGDVAFLLELTK